jgi:ferric-dicitrate binding protein FerR (iron transport regulator)
MSRSNNNDAGNNPLEDAAEHALRDGLRANILSPQAMQRIRRATEIEWRATAGRASRRRWMSLAAAASVIVLLCAVGIRVWVADSAADRGALLGKLARSDSPGIVETRFLHRDVALSAGAPMRSGQALEVHGDSLVALAGGGNLRVARASTIKLISANAVELDRGELYVDIPPAAGPRNPFMVITPAGEFRHVGTQFAVAIVGGATRLRVREGTVRWHAAEGDTADMTVDAGTEVMIEHGRAVTRQEIPAIGRDWAWAEAMAPDIDIENRPLLEFLSWAARETGRTLILVDDAARQQAAAIRMHGTVRGLTTIEALSAVMAATSLRFELPEGAIRVSSARDRAPSSG